MTVELRPNGYPLNKYGNQTLDEVVATSVDSFHMEDMGDGRFWFNLIKGNQEWHFWLTTKRGAAIELTCTDEPHGGGV